MTTNRRGFIRLVGLGAAGAICAVPLTVWADRIRILVPRPQAWRSARWKRPDPAGTF